MVLVRYIVTDIEAAIALYTQQLGFHLDMHPVPAFAMLSHGDLRLVLRVPRPRFPRSYRRLPFHPKRATAWSWPFFPAVIRLRRFQSRRSG